MLDTRPVIDLSFLLTTSNASLVVDATSLTCSSSNSNLIRSVDAFFCWSISSRRSSRSLTWERRMSIFLVFVISSYLFSISFRDAVFIAIIVLQLPTNSMTSLRSSEIEIWECSRCTATTTRRRHINWNGCTMSIPSMRWIRLVEIVWWRIHNISKCWSILTDWREMMCVWDSGMVVDWYPLDAVYDLWWWLIMLCIIRCYAVQAHPTCLSLCCDILLDIAQAMQYSILSFSWVLLAHLLARLDSAAKWKERILSIIIQRKEHKYLRLVISYHR